MKVFVDEDTGAGLGKALRAVGVDADYVGTRRRIRPGTQDEIWLPRAGKGGRIVFSRNRGILQAQAQRHLAATNNVGFIFLPPYLSAFELLRLVLRSWSRLEAIYDTEPGPFAKVLYANGQVRALDFPP